MSSTVDSIVHPRRKRGGYPAAMRALRGIALLVLAVGCGPAPRPAAGAPASVAPPPPSQSARPSSPPLRLCGWNVRKLGHGNATDYRLVAEVIDRHCDVAAIVEVMQKQAGHPGYDQLIGELGAGEAELTFGRWDGSVTDSPRPNTSAGHAEFYAILWRVGVVAPCADDHALRFVADHDGSSVGVGSDRFDREPAFGCFRSLPPADASPADAEHQRGVDFALAAYHARWADGDEEVIAAEVRHLPAVFEAMRAAFPNERDLFVIGDFNLRPDALAKAQPFADRTTGSGSTLNRSGERTDNLYDHLVVHSQQQAVELVGDAEVLDVRHVAPSPVDFFDVVSDHLPVVANLRTDLLDDD